MIPKISKEIQSFINANLDADLHSLLLKKSPFSEISMKEIVQQIKGRKVAEKKFPFLLNEGIIFPPNLNLEQASSEATGNYKAKLVSGKKMLDLTTGFGVDAYFISQNFDDITLVERNTELLEIVENNWKVLNKKANFINQELEIFLDRNEHDFDLVYLDPARRDENKNKVFLLEDLSPSLLEIRDEILKISQKILIKLSPLIDISYLISELRNIAEIHIVAVKNDVKELLILINSKKISERILVKCVNLETDEPEFNFYFNEISSAKSTFNEEGKFLHIPNNAILKTGAFHLISKRFGLKKIHQNSHLYLSNEKKENFPGRILEVISIDAKELKKGEKYNIISKNHPLKPEEIKKKYKLQDGGNQYLIFTQSEKGKIILKSV